MRHPTRVGRYRLGSLLGAGGMAVVYRGEEGRSGRRVAIKLLADNLAADTGLRERFLREASIAARLDHPNVVEVLDSGEASGRPYIVMELVDGSSLAADLERRRTLDEERAMDVTVQLCAALGHAHELGIVHRDVKPANVLLTRDGRVKLADFGIARGLADGRTLTAAGSVLGTIAYLSPEQARGEAIGTASDIWSLGIVIAEMSTGVRPVEPALGRPGEIPRPRGRLGEVVDRCLEHDPARRPTADEVAALVLGSEQPTVARTRVLAVEPEPLPREVKPALPVTPTPSSTLRARPTRARASQWTTALGVALLASIVILVAIAADRPAAPAPARPVRLDTQSPRVQAHELASWLRAKAHG